MKISLDKIALGITNDEVPLGNSSASGILTANSSAEFAFSTSDLE